MQSIYWNNVFNSSWNPFYDGNIITDGDFADFQEIEDIYNVLMAVFCVICAGLASGLTMGLLSLDDTKLEIKAMVGNESEKQAAIIILHVIKQHHLLLVTLLLFNALANETLPIFLGAIVPNYIAIILSVTLVLFFGEIIPSAIFTGPSQLKTASSLINFVYFLMTIFYPISYPISKLLDYCFGSNHEESSVSMSRNELAALVSMQKSKKIKKHVYFQSYQSLDINNTRSPIRRSNNNNCNNNNIIIHKHDFYENDIEINHTNDVSFQEEDDDEDDEDINLNEISGSEINLMTGVLNLSKLTVGAAMIKMNKVFMISSSTRLDEKSLYDILKSGFSRIPVFRRHDKQFLLGYLLVKELILVQPYKNVMVEDVRLREPLFVLPRLGLLDMLNIFQEGHCHLAIVTNDPAMTSSCIRLSKRPPSSIIIYGIVTLEDVLEKVIQNDITDETDSCNRPSIYPSNSSSSNSNNNIAISSLIRSKPHNNSPTFITTSNLARRLGISNHSTDDIKLIPTITNNYNNHQRTTRSHSIINIDDKNNNLYIDKNNNVFGENRNKFKQSRSIMSAYDVNSVVTSDYVIQQARGGARTPSPTSNSSYNNTNHNNLHAMTRRDQIQVMTSNANILINDDMNSDIPYFSDKSSNNETDTSNYNMRNILLDNSFENDSLEDIDLLLSHTIGSSTPMILPDTIHSDTMITSSSNNNNNAYNEKDTLIKPKIISSNKSSNNKNYGSI